MFVFISRIKYQPYHRICMHHLHKHILARHTILHCSAILHAQQKNTKLSVTSPSRTASSGIFATLQLR